MPQAEGYGVDDRVPFEVALAVIAAIGEMDPSHPDEKSVIRDIIEAEGPASAGYLQAIRRTRHSIFYPQLLRLYAYGRSRLPEGDRPGFCLRCGRVFAARLFQETLHPILRVALAERGSFRKTILAMVRSYLHRYTGDRYRLSTALLPRGIRFSVSWAAGDAMERHLAACGIDPAVAMEDSGSFIAGAVQGFLERIVDGFDDSLVRWSAAPSRTAMEITLPAEARFAYENLLRAILGHAEAVEAARASDREEVRREKDLILGSPAMRRTWDLVRRAGASDDIVLLLGESGTGKTDMARRIHALSRRREGPFVEVALTSDVGSDNMVQSDLFGHERGAFTGAGDQKQGLFSLAHGGTLFLDEIGDATPEVQAKLLRVIETSTFRRLGSPRDIRVDVRVIAATNRDLEARVREGKFREDLYYRLQVIPIRLPPLRERSADIPALADYLLARAAARTGGPPRALDPEAARLLALHSWPGNIRELDHALRFAAALADGGILRPEHLPEPLRAPPPPGRGAPAESPEAGPPGAAGPVVDAGALRASLRTGAPPPRGKGARHGDPRHVDHAKRIWLSVLIDEFDGDLAMAARFWDRSSEKTLRALVRAYGLGDRLAAARARRRDR